MKLHYTRRARRHLDGISHYIAERNPDAARQVGARITLCVMLGQKARSAVFAPEDPGIHDASPVATAIRKAALDERLHELPGQARQ